LLIREKAIQWLPQSRGAFLPGIFLLPQMNPFFFFQSLNSCDQLHGRLLNTEVIAQIFQDC